MREVVPVTSLVTEGTCPGLSPSILSAWPHLMWPVKGKERARMVRNTPSPPHHRVSTDFITQIGSYSASFLSGQNEHRVKRSCAGLIIMWPRAGHVVSLGLSLVMKCSLNFKMLWFYYLNRGPLSLTIPHRCYFHICAPSWKDLNLKT